MTEADKQIAKVLERFGETMAGNIWRVQGTAVIYHRTLERIATAAKIDFDPPTMIRAERDEAVILVTGRTKYFGSDEREAWSIGEALIGANYRVSGKQAAYVYAMAEKRAKDRVILKLIDLSGLVYSEEEADDFKGGAAEAEDPKPPPQAAKPDAVRVTSGPRVTFDTLVTQVRTAKSEALLQAVINDPANIAAYELMDEFEQGRIADAVDASRAGFKTAAAANGYRGARGQ